MTLLAALGALLAALGPLLLALRVLLAALGSLLAVLGSLPGPSPELFCGALTHTRAGEPLFAALGRSKAALGRS